MTPRRARAWARRAGVRAALVLIAVVIYVADMDNNRVLKLPAQ
jgi:hypothetical protein